MPIEYWTAKQSADFLGVSVATLYAYVSRKGVRSAQVPGLREHRYLRADIEGIRKPKALPKFVESKLPVDSTITLITEDGPYYRGQLASDLANSASIEAVAALLWEVKETVFVNSGPLSGKAVVRLNAELASAPAVHRALALFPFLETAHPRAFDLSHDGIAQTGADIMRWLTAAMLCLRTPRSDPIDQKFADVLNLRPELHDLLRRLLILSADHGFEEATDAVRAVASTGVTPWRSIATGLSVITGRASKFGRNGALRRLLDEILASSDPAQPILHRIRDREDIPGFASDVYPAGDPRARSLFAFCDNALDDDKDYRRLKQALGVARDYKNFQPNFALAGIFTDIKLGLGKHDGATPRITETPFYVGRCAGWIAHAIEQYGRGEIGRRHLHYRGKLPTPT
jgi:citrate synthase